jgi:sulfate adenylyltransferase subunit 1
MIVSTDNKQPTVSQDITMMVCWFNERPMRLHTRYIICQTTRETVGMIKNINYKVNMTDLSREESVEQLQMNDIASITIRTAEGLIFDPYKENRITGSLIFIDPDTFETIAAGMITA